MSEHVRKIGPVMAALLLGILLSSAYVGRGHAEAKNESKWQYKVVPLDDLVDIQTEEFEPALEKKLNSMAKEGWHWHWHVSGGAIQSVVFRREVR